MVERSNQEDNFATAEGAESDAPLIVDATHVEVVRPRQQRFIRVFFIIALLSVVAGTIVAGLMLYPRYRDRHLAKAEVLVSLGDKKGAIEQVRMHVLAHPNDNEALFRLAQLLLADSQRDAAEDVYKGLASKELNSAKGSVHRRAIEGLYAITEERRRDLESQAESLIARKQFVEVVGIYDQILTILESDHALEAVRTGAHIGMIWLHEFSICNTLAAKAYAQWMIKDMAGMKKTLEHVPASLSGDDENRDKQYRFTADCFSSLLSDKAGAAFKGKDWDVASSLYLFARDQYVASVTNDFDTEVARLQFNAALSMLNVSNYAPAELLIREINEKLPNYDTNRVSDLLEFCEYKREEAAELRRGKEYRRLRNEANELFTSEKWHDAYVSYLSVAKYLLSEDLPKTNATILECQYNAALSARLAKEYEVSKALFLYIQTNAPSYLPDEVSNQLGLVIRDMALDEYDPHWEQAVKAFDAEQWINAVSEFDKCITILLRSGAKSSDITVAQCRYNMALAYYNTKKSRNLEQAIELLVEIQRNCPQYEPLLVREQLADFREFLQTLRSIGR